MNTQKLTQKSIEVIQKAQSIAIDNQNQQIEQVHILVALLTVDDSLIKQILKRMKVNDNFENSVMDEVRKLPKVMGSRKMDSVYVAQDVDEMLNDAEKIAEKATAASRTTGAAQSGKSSQGAAQKGSGSQIATGEEGRQIRKGGDSQIPAGPNSGSEDKTGQSRKGAAGQDRKDSGGQSATRQDRCEKEKVINSSAQPAVRLLKSEGGQLFPTVVRNIHN